MIITLITWIYISFLCWTWGALSLDLIKKYFGDDTAVTPIHACITCFTGLATITTIFSIVSLFYPLGGWPIQISLLIPSFFVIAGRKYKKQFNEGLASIFRLSALPLILGCLCVLLVLTMSTDVIANQDTLAYHAQIIKWIEAHKVIPGLANLHLRYGFQSTWFVSCALFSFNFLKIDALTFINSTVLVWYIIFVVSQINRGLRDQSGKSFSLMWLLLLGISLWSYTQARLAATSGSPDFIVTLYSWLIFYLLLGQAKHKQGSSSIFVLISVLSVYALTLKLSAIPVVLLWIYSNYQLFTQKKRRIILVAFFISLTIAIPFLVRNIITSGYMLFPSEFPDVTNVDWKIQKEKTILLKDYTTAYARLHSTTEEENDLAMNLSPQQWIPRWWSMQSTADKFILIATLISIFVTLFRLPDVLKKNQVIKAGMLTSLSGILFWFVKAPDPRFGFGFIIPFLAIILTQFIVVHKKKGYNLINKSVGLMIAIFSLLLMVYIIYRFAYFFQPSQVITPRGIENVKYNSIKCENHILIIPEISNNCGSLNLPCAYDSCKTFEPRGTRITDGFRPK